MMNMEKIQYNVLEKVNTPDDLKKLSCDELKTLCDEIRAYIIDVLANNPGHLASGLGTSYLFNYSIIPYFNYIVKIFC